MGKNLLTVAAGFVGKALITDLLSKTVEVMAIIRQSFCGVAFNCWARSRVRFGQN